MKTPASILAAGMISIGFLAPFQLPPSILDQPGLVRRVELLKRAYILVTLVSFCSELLAVMWATVAVNQLTERIVAPSASVWDLLQRDCDLAWAATNSHFVVGLVGFMYMVGIRGYLMLLTAEASDALITGTLFGVGSSLCLMVSIVNRGVESGGGDGVRYGATVLDLFGHYVALLYQRATNVSSFGPLELASIGLEVVSVAFCAYAIFSPARLALDDDDDEVAMHEDEMRPLLSRLDDKRGRTEEESLFAVSTRSHDQGSSRHVDPNVMLMDNTGSDDPG